MIGKVQNYDEALDEIEKIDKEISSLLEQDNKYSEMMLLMQKRLVYISEINRLKDNSEMSEQVRQRVKEIFESANSVQEKVKAKRDKIKARLDKNKRIEIKNKKLKY
jgi:DNA repair ATPase RecN